MNPRNKSYTGWYMVIRLALNRNAMTLRELSDRVGVSTSYFSVLNQRGQRPPLGIMTQVAVALGIDIKDIPESYDEWELSDLLAEKELLITELNHINKLLEVKKQ